ncbi:hypothetical protein OPV22_021157 [Ensete ventricosum]|uniref:Uncharacterized protein n=1 Tax=Ensete ventricosum TaxID=4639 RepID=A0AAV8QPN1_ENSVE|nr:hypothetical protein OPV22_021157 [Ensete ventricosum]
MRACVKDEPFQALFLEDLPKGELGALLEPCWLGMIAKSRVLSDSSSVAVYERGAVCPTLAKQLCSWILNVKLFMFFGRS